MKFRLSLIALALAAALAGCSKKSANTEMTNAPANTNPNITAQENTNSAETPETENTETTAGGKKRGTSTAGGGSDRGGKTTTTTGGDRTAKRTDQKETNSKEAGGKTAKRGKGNGNDGGVLGGDARRVVNDVERRARDILGGTP